MAETSAGRSAQAQADAQRAKAQRLMESASRWERGAQGEALAAERLRQLPPLFTVLHDLQVPGSRANIDHLVIGPAGVFVVDAKHYSQPLRVGDGMVWRGRHPIRKELDLVTWEAAQAATVLGVPVHPVLCFVGSELPVPTVDLPPVRVTTDAGLVPAILTGTAGYDINDISRLTLLANRHLPPAATTTVTPRNPRPVPRKGRPRSSTAAGRSRRATAPAARGDRKKKSTKRSLVGGLAWFVLAVLLMLNAGTVGTLVSGIIGRILPAEPPAAASAPDPSVNGDFSCSAAGAGWTLTFAWPGDGPAGGYELATSADLATWTPLATWTSSAQAAPRLDGIGADVAVHVQAMPLHVGRGAPATAGTFRSPAAPC